MGGDWSFISPISLDGQSGTITEVYCLVESEGIYGILKDRARAVAHSC